MLVSLHTAIYKSHNIAAVMWETAPRGRVAQVEDSSHECQDDKRQHQLLEGVDEQLTRVPCTSCR